MKRNRMAEVIAQVADRLGIYEAAAVRQMQRWVELESAPTFLSERDWEQASRRLARVTPDTIAEATRINEELMDRIRHRITQFELRRARSTPQLFSTANRDPTDNRVGGGSTPMTATFRTRKQENPKMMTVSQQQLVDVFVALGYPKATSWSLSSLQKRLAQLPKVAAGADPLEGPPAETLGELIEALEAGQMVTIAVSEVSKPTKKEKGKPAKEAAPTKPAKPGKPAKAPAKAEAPTKPAKAAKKEPKKNGAPSTKEVIYKAWVKSKDKSTKIAAGLHEKTGQTVKLSTIKSWIGSWAHGKGLPACAKQDA